MLLLTKATSIYSSAVKVVAIGLGMGKSSRAMAISILSINEILKGGGVKSFGGEQLIDMRVGLS